MSVAFPSRDGLFNSPRYGDYARLEKVPLDDTTLTLYYAVPLGISFFCVAIAWGILGFLSIRPDPSLLVWAVLVAISIALVYTGAMTFDPNLMINQTIFLTADTVLESYKNGTIGKRIDFSEGTVVDVRMPMLERGNEHGRIRRFVFHDPLGKEIINIDREYYSEGLINDPRLWDLVQTAISKHGMKPTERAQRFFLTYANP